MIKNIIEQIKQITAGENQQKRKLTMLFIALIGIVLLFLGNFFSTKEDKDIDPIDESLMQGDSFEDDYPTINEIEKTYENRLIQLLNEVSGISSVDVMINVDSTYIQIYEADEIQRKQTTDETDTNGGKRKVDDHTDERITSFKRTNNEEVPVHIQTKKPVIRGVLIAANGVEDIDKNREIVESVAKLFDIPTFRISVIAK